MVTLYFLYRLFCCFENCSLLDHYSRIFDNDSLLNIFKYALILMNKYVPLLSSTMLFVYMYFFHSKCLIELLSIIIITLQTHHLKVLAEITFGLIRFYLWTWYLPYLFFFMWDSSIINLFPSRSHILVKAIHRS